MAQYRLTDFPPHLRVARARALAGMLAGLGLLCTGLIAMCMAGPGLSAARVLAVAFACNGVGLLTGCLVARPSWPPEVP